MVMFETDGATSVVLADVTGTDVILQLGLIVAGHVPVGELERKSVDAMLEWSHVDRRLGYVFSELSQLAAEARAHGSSRVRFGRVRIEGMVALDRAADGAPSGR